MGGYVPKYFLSSFSSGLTFSTTVSHAPGRVRIEPFGLPKIAPYFIPLEPRGTIDFPSMSLFRVQYMTIGHKIPTYEYGYEYEYEYGNDDDY